LDKRITMEEATAMVPAGGLLALGGMTLYRRPVAFCVALLDRFVKSLRGGQPEPAGLTLMTFTASYESEILVGAGMISKVRTCYFGMEIFGLAPMFTYLANRAKLEVVEETEASLALGLRAASAGIGFMPGRAWIGTDLPRLRPEVRTIIDPYTGETLMAFPAITPDVAVIHALRADPEGNAQIGENRAVDEDLALASNKVIVTTEEIVPELEKADLVAPGVHAVVQAPRGASPTSCHPLYPMDGEAILEYTEKVSDELSFWKYVQEKWGLE
jgi:glutaconate CoA-transferase, subunit A